MKVMVHDDMVTMLVPAMWSDIWVNASAPIAPRSASGREPCDRPVPLPTYLTSQSVEPSYDVVIVGGGVNGLSLAYPSR